MKRNINEWTVPFYCKGKRVCIKNKAVYCVGVRVYKKENIFYLEKILKSELLISNMHTELN